MDKQSDLVAIKTIQSDNDLQIIHGYGDGGFRISGNRFSGSVFVMPRHTSLWSPATPEKLTAPAILEVAPGEFPSLLLLGVGAAPLSPLQTLADDLKQKGIALELMSNCLRYMLRSHLSVLTMPALGNTYPSLP